MKIKDFDGTLAKIRPFLKSYLEEQGRNTSAVHFKCPNGVMHKNDDEKPAANFWPDEEHWRCLVCGAMGDVFDAATYIEGKPGEGAAFIPENVMYLAKHYKVKIELEEQTFEEKRIETTLQVLEEANELMKAAVKHRKADKVRQYIEERGWSNLVDTFEFGYCRYDKLLSILDRKGFSKQRIREAGLGSKQLLDDRLVFPIRNAYGKIVGFSSRRLNEKDGEKYLNPNTSEIYKKSNILFNFDKARRLGNVVYVLEGYADAFTLHLGGVENVVAQCGLSFSEQYYNLLVKHGVSKAVFCPHMDSAGQTALYNNLKGLLSRKGLQIFVKEVSDVKDPDEYVNAYGIEKFKAIPELSLFEWFLREYQRENTTKEEIFEIVIQEEDLIRKERMCGRFAEVLEVDKSTVVSELQRVEQTTEGAITTAEVLQEEGSFEKALDTFEEWAWSNKGALGLDSGYPILTDKIDGIQDAFYIFGGVTNIGKSSFLLNLASNLIRDNVDKVFVLYFSLDDSASITIPKLIATESNLLINEVRSPILRIRENTRLTEAEIEDYLRRRDTAVSNLRKTSASFALKDASCVNNMEEIEKYIEIYLKIAGRRKLVVCIDNLHLLRSENTKRLSIREAHVYISEKVKRWSTVYGIPLLTISELKKLGGDRRPARDDIKEAVDFQYRCDVIAFLYNDMETNSNSELTFIEDDSDIVSPVVELIVAKNKTSPFKGKLYYKFYTGKSTILECTTAEMDHYRATIV